MSHFAEIDWKTNKVLRVIVAEQGDINSGIVGDAFHWVQTSYNTHGGVHSEGGYPLRKNYAGIGYTYDKVRDAFIPPQVAKGYVLNEETCLWEPPIPYPSDGEKYEWDENNLEWVYDPNGSRERQIGVDI